MKALIVGSNSMVGKALAAKIAPLCDAMLTLDREQADVCFDLEEETPPVIVGVWDVAILCAASFAGDDEAGMLQNARVNALGTIKSAALAVRSGCRHIILLSSVFVQEHSQNEYWGSYGLSKRQGEENARLFCQRHGIKLTILRLTQLYDAAGQARKHQSMLYRIIDCAAQGEEVLVYGSKDPERNFLFLDDLLEIVTRTLAKGIEGTFSCYGPQTLRLSEIAAIAFRLFGQREQIRFLPEKADIPTVFIEPDHCLYELIDYSPATGFETGISKVREYRQQ
ncbi:MAG: NAD(P)-dependent oxidoreductase [Desulfuromonadales bacterium]|nr:NAD(P)-dependent oxidoreductase [Desulfuromonadales bacterium]